MATILDSAARAEPAGLGSYSTVQHLHWMDDVVRCADHWRMRRPPRIQKLSDRFGDYVLVITCRECKHGRRTEPQAIAKLLGWDAPLAKVAARMRCSNCGAKGCDLTTESILRPRGVPKNPH